MSESKLCPHCGAKLPEVVGQPQGDPSTARGEPEFPASGTAALGDSVSDMPLLAPGSNDDTFVNAPNTRKAVHSAPDPMLGKFVATGSGIASSLSTDRGNSRPSRSRRTTSSGSFPVINLEKVADPPTASAAANSASAAELAHEIGDEDNEVEEPRSLWSTVLLASYASAVTIALVWFITKGPNRQKSETTEAPVTAKPNFGPTNSDLSRRVQNPEPIEGDHMAKMGQPLKVGSLEITPLDVKRKDVKLQRANVLSQSELRDGGKKALVLRLKIRNISDDLSFAPLDPAYLRDRGQRLVDTFVTTADKERIYPFDLAVESEWTIVGQDFSELRPGESRIISIVTRPDAPPDEAGPFTWRVRLRTGIDRTDAIGLIWPAPSEN